jgi:hypothetical protein
LPEQPPSSHRIAQMRAWAERCARSVGMELS